jgi:CheY-like chemotaxis protein
MLRKEEKQRELLVLAAKRAEAANNAKSDFLSNMSHDIRTPMNAILGMTSIAMVHIDDKEKVMDALNKITRSGKHLLGIINSVLDMSKIESGKLILDETNFNLLRSLEDLKDLFQSQFRAKHLDFTLDAASIEHAEVVGDEQRLQQVFVNILGNAVKFTPEGGKITVTAREKRSALYQRGSYEFIFEDNGIGMEKEFVERVFEPFVRATDSRITNIEGSGLGMAIAQNVVRLMGGDIQVESEPGKGSRFTVAVSLRLNDTIPEENKPREQSKTAELEELIAHDYSDKRALLVDDNELNIEVAKELLGMAGLQVDTAGNGREAVDQLTNSPPGTYDLVFMDIQMPVMNGYEATRAIRNSEREDLQKIPIIAMTADAFAEDIKKAREAGMSGHIAKPIDISRLEQNMEEWLK